MQESYVKNALEEIKGKFGEIDDLKAKIEDIQVAEVDDVRHASKSAKEAKDAVDRLEASIEKLPQEWRDDVKNILDTAPDVGKQAKTRPEEWIDATKMTESDFDRMGGNRPTQMLGQPEGTVFRTSFASPYEMQKAAGAAAMNNLDPEGVSSTDTANIQGGVVNEVHTWHKAIVGDPWVQAGAFQMPLSAGSFKTLEASSITFDSTTVKPTNTAFDSFSGKVQETGRTTKTHTMRVVVSHNQEDDVAGITAYILRMIQLAYGKARGGATTTAVVSGALAANNVKTAARGTAYAADKVVGGLLSLTSKGDIPDYWPSGGAFVLSPTHYTTLIHGLASVGGYQMAPSTTIGNFMGWGLTVDTQAAAFANDAKTDFFGSWPHALIQAQVGRLTVDRYMATIPGAIAIYAQFRFLPVVHNNAAYGHVGLTA